MTKTVEQIEQEIKELRKKKSEALKKEKAKKMEQELEELRAFKKEVLAIDKLEQIQLKINRWNEINSTIKSLGYEMKDVAPILKQALSQKPTQ